MKHRKLRIAWSVAWGVVAVLLVVLWVRSWSRDAKGNIHGTMWTYGSAPGSQFYFSAHSVSGVILTGAVSHEANANWILEYPKKRVFDIGLKMDTRSVSARIPYYFAVLLAVLISVTPWAPYRFSLRTLLIATTLVAVVLGLIVWLR